MTSWDQPDGDPMRDIAEALAKLNERPPYTRDTWYKTMMSQRDVEKFRAAFGDDAVDIALKSGLLGVYS